MHVISLKALDEIRNSLHHNSMIEWPPAERLGLVGYGVVVGIGASALGAWASSPVQGSARIGAWVAVTGVLAVAFGWFAESIVMLLARTVRYGIGRRTLPR